MPGLMQNWVPAIECPLDVMPWLQASLSSSRPRMLKLLAFRDKLLALFI